MEQHNLATVGEVKLARWLGFGPPEEPERGMPYGDGTRATEGELVPVWPHQPARRPNEVRTIFRAVEAVVGSSTRFCLLIAHVSFRSR